MREAPRPREICATTVMIRALKIVCSAPRWRFRVTPCGQHAKRRDRACARSADVLAQVVGPVSRSRVRLDGDLGHDQRASMSGAGASVKSAAGTACAEIATAARRASEGRDGVGKADSRPSTSDHEHAHEIAVVGARLPACSSPGRHSAGIGVARVVSKTACASKNYPMRFGCGRRRQRPGSPRRKAARG